MLKAYEYRIYLNKEQEERIKQHFGCSRWIYNYALEEKIKAWNTEKKNLSRFDIQKDLPKLKKAEETKWLKEVNAQSLQASLGHLDKAFKKIQVPMERRELTLGESSRSKDTRSNQEVLALGKSSPAQDGAKSRGADWSKHGMGRH